MRFLFWGRKKKLGEGSTYHQYLATFTGCVVMVTAGMHFGWPSQALPQLLEESSHIEVSNSEGSWLAVMPCWTTIFGGFLAAWMVDNLGRKSSLLFASPLYFVAWMLIAFANRLMWLYMARLVSGMADGIVITALPVYVCEIASPNIRGLLGSIAPVSLLVGFLFVNIIGSHLSIPFAAMVSSLFPAIHFITFCWMPESPYYVLMKDNTEAAKSILEKLRGHDNVYDEMRQIHGSVKCDSEGGSSMLDLFRVRSNRRAVIIGFGVRLFQQLSGIMAITFYARTIFNEADSVISPQNSTILYFAVQVLVSCVSTLLVDRTGRKPLLIVSMIGSGISLAVEAIYFYVKDYTSYDTKDIDFLPLTALIAFVVIFNLGMGTIPVLMLGELFPTSVKGVALCLSDIYFGVIVIVISKFFQMVKDEFGMYVPFGVFAGCCCLGLVFVIKCVPETNGKTLEEIQLELKGDDTGNDVESKKPESEVNVIPVGGPERGGRFCDVPLDSYKSFNDEFEDTRF